MKHIEVVTFLIALDTVISEDIQVMQFNVSARTFLSRGDYGGAGISMFAGEGGGGGGSEAYFW